MTNINYQNKSKATTPLVSICVPAYNGAPFLKECLESIQKQTYSNWECIVLDNCSKDETFNIGNAFAKRDSRIRVYQNKDFLNVMQNWNEIFHYVSESAAYYKIVPADDIIFPEFLEKMVGLMEAHPSVGLCSSYRIDGVEIRGRGLDYFEGPVFKGKTVFEKEIMATIDVTGSANSYLVRMEYLKQLKGFPKFYNEKNLHIDMELAYDLLNVSDFGFVFQALSYTRQHPKSLTESVTYKYNTSISSREQILFKYHNEKPKLNEYYKNIRLIYAAFYLKNKLLGNKKCIEWHDAYIIRPFTLMEYCQAIILKNRVSYKLFRRFGRK